MKPQRRTRRHMLIAGLAVVMCFMAFGYINQSHAQQQDSTPPPAPLASNGDLCTGFISDAPLSASLQITGALKEKVRDYYLEGDVVYLNKGIEAGISQGTVYDIVRPMGPVVQPFTKKKLGYFVRELGILRVVSVGDSTSTAKIAESCDTIWLSDALIPYQPLHDNEGQIVKTSSTAPEGNAALKGQIFMERDYHENLTAGRIVYIDLGANQGVHPGDTLTIYRKIGRSEGLINDRDDQISSRQNSDYGSDRYHGAPFSLDTPSVPKEKVVKTRPPLPDKIVGEIVLLKVDNTASVARIVKSSEEVNLGDYVRPAR